MSFTTHVSFLALSKIRPLHHRKHVSDAAREIRTLYTDVFGQLHPRQLELGKAAQDILQRGASPEVLLLQTKKLAGVHVVVGVEHLGLSHVSLCLVPLCVNCHVA